MTIFFFVFDFNFSTLQKGTDGFWKSVAHSVPREPTEIRILNPYFIQEAAFQFIGLPINNYLMGKGVRHTYIHSLMNLHYLQLTLNTLSSLILLCRIVALFSIC